MATTAIYDSKQFTKIVSSSTTTTNQMRVAAPSGCVVADSTHIEGIVRSEGHFRLDGAINGSISCEKKLIVGVNGSVTGSVWANEADISGVINGNIETAGMLILRKTSYIKGEIKAQIISIEEGAIYDGKCQIG